MRNSLNNYLLLFLSIIFSFFAAEIILRLHYGATYGRTLEDAYKVRTIDRPYYSLAYLVRPSQYWKIVYSLRPGLDVMFLGKRLVTNSAGFREKEFSMKEEGAFRIIGIGDSYMFGYGVEEKERYMDRLESMLNKAENRYETFVLAVPGYNFMMEKEVLERYGMELEPDMIIYEFVNNDLCLPNFIAPAHKFTSLESFTYLYAMKAFGDYHDLYNTDEKGNMYEDICETAGAPEEYKDIVGKENFENAVSEFSKLSEKSKLVFFVPVPSAHDKNVSEWLHSFPAKYPEIEFIFMEEADAYLQQENVSFYGSDLVIGNGNYHFSERGHNLIAKWLYDELAKRELFT